MIAEPQAGLQAIAGAQWALLLAAPFVGSFLGLVIRRLPAGRPIVRGRSRCEHCRTPLGPRDLVPLLGWLLARGRCRHCSAPLGAFYPAVEGAALALAAISVAVDSGGTAWLTWLLGCALLALAWIDLRCWLLPDAITLPLLAAGLAAALALAPDDLPDRAAGAAIGYLALAAAAWFYRRMRGSEGLGRGDAKLFAAAGAWVGASGLPSVLFAAAAAGLLATVGMRLAGHAVRRDTALPFGPFLALATWLIWLFGPVF